MGISRNALLAVALLASPSVALAQDNEPFVQVDLLYPRSTEPVGPDACLLVAGAAAVGLEAADGQRIATTLDPSVGSAAEGQRFVPVAPLEPGSYRVLIDPSPEVVSWAGEGQYLGGNVTVEATVTSSVPEIVYFEAVRHENYYGVWLLLEARGADSDGFPTPARLEYDLGIDGAFDGEPDLGTAWGGDGDLGVPWPDALADASLSSIQVRTRLTTLDGEVGVWSNPVAVTQQRYDATPPSVACAAAPGRGPVAPLAAFLAVGLMVVIRRRAQG